MDLDTVGKMHFEHHYYRHYYRHFSGKNRQHLLTLELTWYYLSTKTIPQQFFSEDFYDRKLHLYFIFSRTIRIIRANLVEQNKNNILLHYLFRGEKVTWLWFSLLFLITYWKMPLLPCWLTLQDFRIDF